METDTQSIDNIRAMYDAEIMAIQGVVSVSIGIGQEGNPCLKIGTSAPVEKIRPLLPAEIFKVKVELEFQGEITAQ